MADRKPRDVKMSAKQSVMKESYFARILCLLAGDGGGGRKPNSTLLAEVMEVHCLSYISNLFLKQASGALYTFGEYFKISSKLSPPPLH